MSRVWDIAEVHRLLHGTWTADAAHVWAAGRGLPEHTLPQAAIGSLFDEADIAGDDPVRPDGYLRPDALAGWLTSPQRAAALAHLALAVRAEQVTRIEAQSAQVAARLVSTAHAESAAALLCLELERDGLPVDIGIAERIIAGQVGHRPRDDADAAGIRAERDARVTSLGPQGSPVDLRNAVQVKDWLAQAGVDVPSTRAWLLEPFRAQFPVVDALLTWRKEERIATTYGYRWLDEHIGQTGRLRGAWTSCDGGAGRMTAANGLHNLPSPLREAVVAEPGWVFVRADLGQIEPRILAVVSADEAFAAATVSDDLYAPVSATLGVPRDQAKVAVLAAMYGQRSGSAGQALARLERAFPTAMTYLDRAYDAGVQRQPVRTFGGRLIRSDPGPADAGARGRYVRNAVIQGAAAEFFKAWVATIRHGLASSPAHTALCLHDEILVHTPRERADDVAALVLESLQASAARWTRGAPVRFVADLSIVRCWADAKS